jgi:hypothetical protein
VCSNAAVKRARAPSSRRRPTRARLAVAVPHDRAPPASPLV